MQLASKISKIAIKFGSIIGISIYVCLPATSFALGSQSSGAVSSNQNSGGNPPQSNHTGTNDKSITTNPNSERSNQSTSQFCTNLVTESGFIKSKFGDLTTKLAQARSQQTLDMTNEWTKVDQLVSSDRLKADNSRAADFSKLESKATSVTEKQAVISYEKSINDAVSVRRAAFDSARLTYRSAVKNAITVKHNQITAQLTTFQNSVNSALSIAMASCANNPNGFSAIHATFQASMKSAHDVFQTERNSDNTVKSQVQQLTVIRDASFKSAEVAFEASHTAASTILQQAFGGSGKV